MFVCTKLPSKYFRFNHCIDFKLPILIYGYLTYWWDIFIIFRSMLLKLWNQIEIIPSRQATNGTACVKDLSIHAELAFRVLRNDGLQLIRVLIHLSKVKSFHFSGWIFPHILIPVSVDIHFISFMHWGFSKEFHWSLYFKGCMQSLSIPFSQKDPLNVRSLKIIILLEVASTSLTFISTLDHTLIVVEASLILHRLLILKQAPSSGFPVRKSEGLRMFRSESGDKVSHIVLS